jgi:Fe-S-cluster-containing hydrogenase component 2
MSRNYLLFWAGQNFAACYFLRARPCAASCPGVAIGFKTGCVQAGTLAYSFL